MVKDHINKMYHHDVIRPSNSSWASPILLVQKKNGKTRFCVDYCKLNEVSIKDAYPLPRMDDIFSVLGKASYYTTIDLTDAFCVVGEVMKERRRRERERLINLSTCGCVIQLYLWENTQFIEIREFGWGFLMLTS